MTSRISYNSKTIDFPVPAYSLQMPDYSGIQIENVAAVELVETLNVSSGCMFRISFRNLLNSDSTHATFKRNLQQWYRWACKNGVWYFSYDNAEEVLTTLTTGPAAGATSFDVTSVTGIDNNGLYVIRNLTDSELVKVLSVSGSTVNIAETLNYDFAVGDRFRSELYWPARLINRVNPIIERPPLMFDVDLLFMEDCNSL
jgi:hypothetical protein